MPTVLSRPPLSSVVITRPDGAELVEPVLSEHAAAGYVTSYNRLMRKLGKPARAAARPVLSVTLADVEGGAA
ncbi:MAG: hypothetical protein HQ582_10530 [Planctomycetes bacterium]|nr:hypothetical protein [Planctomycetota bacterium]